MIIGVAAADHVRLDMSGDWVEQWGGSGHVRIGQYMPFLRAAGHTVVSGYIQDANTHINIMYEEGKVVTPDIVYVQRLMHQHLGDLYTRARRSGQIIVNDVDDWYWGLSTRNMAFINTHPKVNSVENTTFYKNSIVMSSYITVSTPFLGTRVPSAGKVPVTVIPNYVDTATFKRVPITDTTCPEVGWVGSTQHRSGDVETLRGVLGPMAERGDIKIVHAGDGEGAPSFASQLGIPDSLVHRISQRCNADKYPDILDFEVGLVPLHDVPFNEAKSDLKGLEYAASGIPFVAAHMPSYTDLYKDWSTGGVQGLLLAKKASHWISNINRLRDPSFRKENQEALLENVKTRDIAIGAAKLIGYLESLKPR